MQPTLRPSSTTLGLGKSLGVTGDTRLLDSAPAPNGVAKRSGDGREELLASAIAAGPIVVVIALNVRADTLSSATGVVAGAGGCAVRTCTIGTARSGMNVGRKSGGARALRADGGERLASDRVDAPVGVGGCGGGGEGVVKILFPRLTSHGFTGCAGRDTGGDCGGGAEALLISASYAACNCLASSSSDSCSGYSASTCAESATRDSEIVVCNLLRAIAACSAVSSASFTGSVSK